MTSSHCLGSYKKEENQQMTASSGPRLACNRTPTRMGTSRRRRRTLRGVITLLSSLRLGGPRRRALLHGYREVHHLHSLLPTRGEITSIPKPPFLLRISLKYSKPTLLPNICHHKLSEKKQSRVGKNDCMKAIRSNKRKPTAAQQLLLKCDHHGLPVPMHSYSTNTLPL